MTLRDCQAWEADDLKLSTASNEAAKLFDDAVTQYVSWTENEQLGGIEGTVKKMLEFDPNFVMGNMLSFGLELMGTGRSIRIDKELNKDMFNFQALVKSHDEQLTEREKLHCKAVVEFAEGNYNVACKVWEDILQSHPNDLLAVKFAHDAYFYLGDSIMIRDSVGRVLPHWQQSDPMYGYLQGMYAFGLEETNIYPVAERYANEALQAHPTDCWATHAKAHCLEMTGQFENGIDFMESTEKDWSKGKMLACHNYWHWALYHIEKGEYDKAISLYDQQVHRRTLDSGACLDIVDAVSLLKRFEIQGVDIGDRWNSLHDICRPHLDDHITVFNDIHYLMAYVGSKKENVVEEYMSSVDEFCSTEKHFSRDLFANIGVNLCKGLIAYESGRHDEAVEFWYPIKLDVVRIGGSHAQRDVFQQLLINACLSSKCHLNLGQALINERKLLKENSPLTDRLMIKMLSRHEQ